MLFFFSRHTVNKISAFSFAKSIRVNTHRKNKRHTARKKRDSQYVPCIIRGLPTDEWNRQTENKESE